MAIGREIITGAPVAFIQFKLEVTTKQCRVPWQKHN
jgi:hypothetical protein